MILASDRRHHRVVRHLSNDLLLELLRTFIQSAIPQRTVRDVALASVVDVLRGG